MGLFLLLERKEEGNIVTYDINYSFAGVYLVIAEYSNAHERENR